MDYTSSYTACGHPDEKGDPEGDALRRAMDRVKCADEAYDLLIDIAGAEWAESVLIEALENIAQRNRTGDDERLSFWYRRKSA